MLSEIPWGIPVFLLNLQMMKEDGAFCSIFSITRICAQLVRLGLLHGQ